MLEHKPSDSYPIRQLLCVAAIADGCMRVMKKGGGKDGRSYLPNVTKSVSSAVSNYCINY